MSFLFLPMYFLIKCLQGSLDLDQLVSKGSIFNFAGLVIRNHDEHCWTELTKQTVLMVKNWATSLGSPCLGRRFQTVLQMTTKAWNHRLGIGLKDKRSSTRSGFAYLACTRQIGKIIVNLSVTGRVIRNRDGSSNTVQCRHRKRKCEPCPSIPY